MLAAIASLLVVVMITILLHLCTKYLLRRQERRRPTALNLQRTQIAAFYESSINSPKSGLDPLVLASLPMYTCKLTTGQAEPTVWAPEDKELCSMVQPTAPPLMESTPIDAAQMGKGGLGQDLVPLKGCLMGERSSRRFQNCGEEVIETLRGSDEKYSF
ncbi:hypothetical protein V6N13_011440 [Hibiscus sabdariffa]